VREEQVMKLADEEMIIRHHQSNDNKISELWMSW